MKKSQKKTAKSNLSKKQQVAKPVKRARKKLTKAEYQQRIVDRYRTFAHFFVTTSNGTQSAIEAGFTKRSAHSTANRLLKNAKVQEFIAEIRAELEELRLHDREDWLRELDAVAFSRMKNVATWGPGYLEMHESESLSERAHAAVAEVKEKTTTITTKDGGEITRTTMSVKLHDKLNALIKYGMARAFCKNDGLGLLDSEDQRPMIQINQIIIGGKDAEAIQQKPPQIEI